MLIRSGMKPFKGPVKTDVRGDLYHRDLKKTRVFIMKSLIFLQGP